MKTRYIGPQLVPYVAEREPSDRALPCPFCGCTTVHLWRGEEEPFRPYYVECDACDARATDHSTSFDYRTPETYVHNEYDHRSAEDHKASAERALRWWNMRVTA